MQTDTSRAFEEWARSGRYSTGGIRGALMRAAWRAAVAWATARERERAAQKAEECGKRDFRLGALGISGDIAAAIRSADGGKANG